jgi:hypothetical protein
VTLPTAYLTSFKNLPAIFQAIQAAQAPPRFTQKFLEGLGFPNTNDRIIINVLKALQFLDDTGVPTKRYHEYLDQTRSAQVLAQAIQDAYDDLFRVNKTANKMSTTEVKNKMKTLSEGQFTDRVLTQMSGTFTSLVKLADFDSARDEAPSPEQPIPEEEPDVSERTSGARPPSVPRIGGLVYSINLQLPESRDQAVYDALFKSLKQHLLS